MTARPTSFYDCDRPRRWSAALSLLALLTLVLSPLCQCAMAEASPGHPHSAAGSLAASNHEAAAPEHHANNHRYKTAHHNDGQKCLSSVPESHLCCCDSHVPPVVLDTLLHSPTPDASSLLLTFAPAILPETSELFVPAYCRGRDGPPPAPPLRSQFLPSSLLGRAPPAFV